MEITRTVETRAPREKVFAYLSDFTSTNEWDPGTVETRRMSGDGGVGTRYLNTSSFLGRKTRLEYVVVDRVENERIVLQGNNKTVKAVDTMTMDASASGTRLTYNAAFEFKGLTKLLAPLMAPVLVLAFKKLGDEAEAGLQKALDRL